MSNTQNIQWKRLSVEGAAIVMSILLAFAIVAWWDDRTDTARTDELLIAIRSDVEATQTYIEGVIAFRKKVIGDAQALLEAMAGGTDRATLDSRLLTLGSVFVMSSWYPVNHTYEQALGSGSFELVRDSELRLLLAQYVAALEEVGLWDDNVIRQYYSALEPFMVTQTAYSELAAPDVRDLLVADSPFQTDLSALAENRELWNLLTLKLELEAIFVSRLEDADAIAIELLAVMPDSL
jgi:hypothetical protein